MHSSLKTGLSSFRMINAKAYRTPCQVMFHFLAKQTHAVGTAHLVMQAHPPELMQLHMLISYFCHARPIIIPRDCSDPAIVFPKPAEDDSNIFQPAL